MYAEHFGLNRPPFRATATGTDVFLGPQTAATIKAVRKALGVQDAVVTISGPVGIGKTAIVGRSLDAVGGKQTRIRIGRMSIAHDEILDYLLDVLGITDAPASTIRRIALFRAVLAQKRQEDERVFVIVEDGTRLGEDPLAELEALTAADGGAGGGAAILIMGDTSLNAKLDKRSLARLNQRIRLRHSLQALSEGELTGYLKHCFRTSGGEFDAIFDEGTASVLCQLSGGIPRVCNNLVESSLSAAAEQGIGMVDMELLKRIARDEYGLTSKSTSADVSQVAEALILPVSKEEDAQPEIELTQSMAAPLPDFADGHANSEPSPAAEPAPEPAAADDDVPEFINDTIPELTPLLQEPADKAAAEEEIPTLETPEAPAAEQEPAPAPAPASAAATTGAASEEAEQKPEPTPELSLDDAAEPTADAAQPATNDEAPRAPAPGLGDDDANDDAPADDDVPAWDRDPTLAQLRPDLEALESAMAESAVESDEAPSMAAPAEPDMEVKDPSLNDIPELRLEESIQKSIAEATAALEKHDSTIAEGLAADELANAAPEPAAAKQADGEIEKIARGLARAKTLDDVDDKMAETLFGEEFSMIAAEVAASCANMNFDDEDEVEEEEPPALSLEPEAEAEPAAKPAPAAAAASATPQAPASKPAAAAPATQPRGDSSPSARLRTVQALNASKQQGQPSAEPAAAPPKAANSTPATIENQFADIASVPKPKPPAAVDDDDDDDDDGDAGKKGGFFSRFKRS